MTPLVMLIVGACLVGAIAFFALRANRRVRRLPDSRSQSSHSRQPLREVAPCPADDATVAPPSIFGTETEPVQRRATEFDDCQSKIAEPAQQVAVVSAADLNMGTGTRDLNRLSAPLLAMEQGTIAVENIPEPDESITSVLPAFSEEKISEAELIQRSHPVREETTQAPSETSDRARKRLDEGTISRPEETLPKPPVEIQAMASTVPSKNEIVAGADITEHNEEILVPAAPSAYQAPRVKVTRAKRKPEQSNSSRAPKEQDRSLRLIVKARVHRDFWTVGLLAERPSGAPPELEVKLNGTTVQLFEAGDGFYEVSVEEALDWLNGAVLIPKNQRAGQWQWQLTARDLHVLASDGKVSAWASTTRLTLGRKHIVLCRESRVEKVASVLAEAGCENLQTLGADSGAPPGWKMFFPVIPTRPARAVADEDLWNVLRPPPDSEILFENGLRVQGSTWMEGYPPIIRVTGALADGEQIFLDGHAVERRSDGQIIAPSCGHVGSHDVSIGGRLSRTYSVSEPELPFELWTAHKFSNGNVCGVLAKPIDSGAAFKVTIPSTNPLLVGSKSGEVFVCSPQPGQQWTVFVPFQPVWALPGSPSQCDKKTCRIICLADQRPQRGSSPMPRRQGRLWRWIQAIRDAQRKGLTVIGGEAEKALWREYSQMARQLWRATR